MSTTLGERIKKSWDIFMGRDDDYSFPVYKDYGQASYFKPDRPRLTRGNERSIINSIYNRIAVDVSTVSIRHVKLDKNDRYVKTIDSPLNNCLTLDANIDQTGKSLIRDIVISMFDEGCVAVVPITTSEDPNITGSYDIYELRTGKILEWYPQHVKLFIYDEKTGRKRQKIVAKNTVAIIENPFYAIMNEPNSTLQRLIRILNNIDKTNEMNSAGKMDLIIQLPYLAHSEKKINQAEARRKLLEQQLTGSQYGIGYIDATEHIVQLNRSIENNLWAQAQDLKKDVFNQLGLTETIFNGTAKEEEELEYYNKTIEPILSAITDEMKRKFLTPTARTQKQSITYFREPFKLIPVNQVAEIADKFTRNEILSSNELRSIIGFKPVDDPKADQLINANLNQSNAEIAQQQQEKMPKTDPMQIEEKDRGIFRRDSK